MKFYYVYILSCSDGSYYTGMTNDLDRRMQQHKSGSRKDSYTYNLRLVELKWYLQCTNPSEAIKVEKQIKGWTKRKKRSFNSRELAKFSSIFEKLHRIWKAK